MALEWADFPSGQPGIYGQGPAATLRMLNGTPWVNIGASAFAGVGLTSDPDPGTPSGSVAFRPETSITADGFDGAPAIALSTPTNQTLWAAARIWISGFTNLTIAPFAFMSLSTGRAGYYVRIEINGAISIIRRNGFNVETVLATTTVPVVSANTWGHYSFQVNFTTGVCSVHREGAEILSVTDSSPLAFVAGFFKTTRRVAFETSPGPTYFIKDLVIGNGFGSQNNGHPGTVSVFDLRPDADETLGGWVPSSGSTGFNLLDETPPNDTGFISADDSPPAPSEFRLTNLPSDVTSVRGLISIVRARKIDGGDGNLQIALTPNGTDYDNGADRAITTAFSYWSDVSETSPATSGNWTPGEVDATRVRVNRTL